MKLRTNVQGGKIAINHNATLRVRTTVRAGKLATNHNEAQRA